MYKVFFNDNFLVLTNKGVHEEKSTPVKEYQGFSQIENWLQEVEKSAKNLILICEEPNKVLHEIQEKINYIRAAGGLVKSKKGKYLFIFRRGKWDLPKGKIDKGETIEHAAIREVVEETGLKNVFITEKIMDTYHFYRTKSKLNFKKTYWYAMKNMGDDKLVPQTEEDIEEAKWVKAEQIRKLKENMFASVAGLTEKLQLA